MHEIGTVRAALILGELQDYRNTVEAFTVRGSTILDIPPQEQEWMLAELRHARRGCVLTVHVLLLCAAGRTPTEIATFLFCSRRSVYRIVNAYHPHWRNPRCDQPIAPV